MDFMVYICIIVYYYVMDKLFIVEMKEGDIMKRSEKAFPMKDTLFEKSTIREYWDEGIFDEYSDSHFLIQIMNGDTSLIHRYLLDKNVYEDCQDTFSLGITFLINFTTKLKALSNYFGQKNIKDFMKNQFAAGKNNYSEDLFFEALSEIHILCYFIGFGPALIREAKYEPKLGETKKNPEARLVYENDMVLDIEVKTPRFDCTNWEKESILPLRLLSKDGVKELSQYCYDSNITCIFPRALKIKDYINSAGSKFVKPKTNKHVNLLVLNWSYSNVIYEKIQEPYSIFCNNINGIFTNINIAKQLGISMEALKKISAILIYSIPNEMLIFGDARYLFKSREYKLIINPFCDEIDEDVIWKMTRMTITKGIQSIPIVYFDIDQQNISKLKKVQDLILENALQLD